MAKQMQNKNRRAVFILSTPRSGSTLLRVMLAGSSGIFAPPELELLRFNTFNERANLLVGRSSYAAEGLVRAIMQAHQCDIPTAQAITDQFAANDVSISAVYEHLQKAIGTDLLVDKTVSYATDPAILERAEEIFEEPLYIHLTRHPRGMIRSFVEGKHHLFRDEQLALSPSEQAELIWLISHDNIVQFLSHIAAERQHRVSFEQLVANPLATMHQISEFLGISFNDLMVQPYADNGRRMTDGIHPGSRTLSDVKFARYYSIDPAVAIKWQSSPATNPLYEQTWAMAEQLGYPGPQYLREVAFDVDDAAVASPHLHRLPSYAPLSFGQERLWFIDHLVQQPVYNMSRSYSMTGELNLSAFERSISALMERHEILRTTFYDDEGVPRQQVDIAVASPFQWIDVSGANTELDIARASVRTALYSDADASFDLSVAPLMRVRLYTITQHEHVLLLTLHHIISDGISLDILQKELADFYRAYLHDRTVENPTPVIQYADYAIWQRRWMQSESVSAAMEYWQRHLQGAPAVIGLPVDFIRPKHLSYSGATVTFTLDRQTTEQLRALAASEATTLFVVLLAGFALTLSSYAGQRDMLIGTPAASRNRPELEGAVGLFINVLALRVKLPKTLVFRELVQQLHKVSIEAHTHQDVP
nr:sulfotransferase [Herpetosiphonaceae bacterium]